jgi:hypothetical protein
LHNQDAMFAFIAITTDQGRPAMKDSDLLFNILTAAALGVVIMLAPIGVWAAQGGVSPERSAGIEGGTRVQLTLSERLGTVLKAGMPPAVTTTFGYGRPV